MSGIDSDDLSGREGRLHDVILAYLEAVERGPAPDRRQWLTRYPEFAPELAAFFAGEPTAASWWPAVSGETLVTIDATHDSHVSAAAPAANCRERRCF